MWYRKIVAVCAVLVVAFPYGVCFQPRPASQRRCLKPIRTSLSLSATAVQWQSSDRPPRLFQQQALAVVKRAGCAVLQLVATWLQALKRAVALLMVALCAFGSRVDVGSLSTGVAVAGASIFVAPQAAQAGVLKRYTKLSPTQKLATTPLFFVSNSGGSPYLQEDVQAGKPSQRIIVYFMSSEDASDYMDEMAQGSPGNVNEFRIKATSMEKIINSIQKRKQSRKLGRFSIGTIYRIQPSSRQCQNAERVAGAGNAVQGAKTLKGMAIPMFTTRGLAMQRGTGELLTPYYFAYEDMLEDWAKVVREAEAGNRKLPATPSAVVKDFTEVMCLAQGITSESVSPRAEAAKPAGEKGAAAAEKETLRALKVVETVGVVPPRREIEMLRNFYRNKAGFPNEFSPARIIGAPR